MLGGGGGGRGMCNCDHMDACAEHQELCVQCPVSQLPPCRLIVGTSHGMTAVPKAPLRWTLSLWWGRTPCLICVSFLVAVAVAVLAIVVVSAVAAAAASSVLLLLLLLLLPLVCVWLLLL